jgi:hypothetical protein
MELGAWTTGGEEKSATLELKANRLHESFLGFLRHDFHDGASVVDGLDDCMVPVDFRRIEKSSGQRSRSNVISLSLSPRTQPSTRTTEPWPSLACSPSQNQIFVSTHTSPSELTCTFSCYYFFVVANIFLQK